MSIKSLIGVILSVTAVACADIGASDATPIGADAPVEFAYRFHVPHMSRDELRDAALLYFAFGSGDDVPPTLATRDSDAGALIGKGLAPWLMPEGILCYVHYQFSVVAEDENLSLIYTLDFSDMEGPFSCSSWSKPSRAGYHRIVSNFNFRADGLRTALLAGNGAKGHRGF